MFCLGDTMLVKTADKITSYGLIDSAEIWNWYLNWLCLELKDLTMYYVYLTAVHFELKPPKKYFAVQDR